MNSTHSFWGWAVAAGLALAGPALADGGVEDLDASLPDASVGSGGADRDTPDEGDGRPVVFCRMSRDCEKGFTCQSGKCTWVGYREATGPGCLGAAGAAGLTLGSIAVRRRRRRK